MDCPACERENKLSARFCAFCGTPLGGEFVALQPGQFVDNGTYRIIRPLGKGGMGAVYLAANTKAFNRQCVVKEVIEYYDPTDARARQKAMQRFEIEARTLASLKHPGVPDIYAYFSENGRNYLVMEYIEGRNLAQGLTRKEDGRVVKGRPQPVEEVVRNTIQICEVLSYLEHHQPPVIHNDIKPANIILDKIGERAVLVDFGTARTRYTRQGAGQPGKQQSSVYGTVGYAATELYDGKAEPRSDVYALAATAYHLLTDDNPRAHPFSFPETDMIPEPVRQALTEALDNDVEKRPFAAQLAERLENALRTINPQLGSAALVPPLTFPNGNKATTRRELIALSIKNWDYARDILYDGSIAHWLRDALHDPAASRAAQTAVQKYDDSNAGLEYFIRTLDPKAMPSPQLSITTGQLRYERVVEQDSSKQIKVTNKGGGYLYGTATSSAPWVKVAERLRCAPGQTQSLPVTVDVRSLAPGKIYRAKVDIQASGAQVASIPIEVRLPLPLVNVSPLQLYLGIDPRMHPFTDRGAFEIRNVGEGRADCQIEGNPPWLFLEPKTFTCAPGQRKVIELVGRVDLLPANDQRTGATLEIKITGARSQRVQVTLKPREEKQKKRRLGPFIAIGCTSLIVLGSIVGLVIALLQGLIP